MTDTTKAKWIVHRADRLANELAGNGCIEFGDVARDRIHEALEEAFEKGEEFCNDTR